MLRSAWAPSPTAGWPLASSSLASMHGGASLSLHGDQCARTWTGDEDGGLTFGSSCFASANNSPSLSLGAGSFSACLRFRTSFAGVPLLSKLGPISAAAAANANLLRGISITTADGGQGLGISLADGVGVSSFEEIGRSALADGRWHHACIVLQRATHAPSLSLYVDGRQSEARSLRGSRLLHLGVLDTAAPLLLGRLRGGTSSVEAFTGSHVWNASVREVALWTRALLPEHVAAIASKGLPPSHLRRRQHMQRQMHMQTTSGAGSVGMSSAGTAPDVLQLSDDPAQHAYREGRQQRARLPWWTTAVGLLLAPIAFAGCALRRRRLQITSAGIGRWLARTIC